MAGTSSPLVGGSSVNIGYAVIRVEGQPPLEGRRTDLKQSWATSSDPGRVILEIRGVIFFIQLQSKGISDAYPMPRGPIAPIA